MANNSGEGREKIYDVAKNDSRMTITYKVVNNDSLGGGGFGEVFLVQRETSEEQKEGQQKFAMKRIRKDSIVNDKDKLHRVLTEIKIHRSLNSPYICKYEHSFEDKNSIYILMEYCEKKSLEDMFKQRKATEYEARYYMFQVLFALKYLRRQKVIHRDLTLANIFLKDYKTIKIGDFGLSYKENENEEKQGLMCGTQGYFTPESANCKYSYKTDIFDFGVCIHHLMTGNTLFKDAATSSEAIKKPDIIPYDEKTRFSFEARDLFSKIFVSESQRIDLDKIYCHSFFAEGRGLIDVDFPDYSKMNPKEFEEKIKELEKNVIMTNIDFIKKKNIIIKDENYPQSYNPYVTKRSMNNESMELSTKPSLNDTSRAFGLLKNSINSNSNNNNNNINEEQLLMINTDKNKKIRASLKNKNDEQNEREGIKKKNANKKTTFNLDNNDKKIKEKIIPEIIQEEKEITLKETLDLIKKNDNSENKNNEDEFSTFKLRQSNKSLELEFFDEKINNNNEKISFEKNLENEKENKEEEEEEEEKDIYIKTVIELSEKYGIAYQLNNKNIGILFNDFSHILKFHKIKNMIFYVNNNIQKQIFLPLIDDKNKDLNNKVYYLGYIIEELKKKKLKNEKKMKKKKEIDKFSISFDSRIIDDKDINYLKKYRKKNIYLKKFKKNKYAYFFILSNKNIQIDFFDGIKVIFSCEENKKIIYIDKEGNPSFFLIENNKDFANFKCDNPRINKRIKYAIKEIKK